MSEEAVITGSDAQARDQPDTAQVEPGWLAPVPWAAAGGIIVSSGSTRRAAIGLWRPGASRIRVFGHGDVMTTWTQPSGRGSLIAWQPAACSRLSCPIEITSTSTNRTLTVHDPQGTGFLGQGNDAAFSPDGKMLALFVNQPHTRKFEGFVPALVNTATGRVRLVSRAVMANGEMAGWLCWLPGSARLLAGPAADISSYPAFAIDARTASAWPFTFFPTYHDPESPVYDITYGTVLLGTPSSRRGF
jgi:hypothetical protein